MSTPRQQPAGTDEAVNLSVARNPSNHTILREDLSAYRPTLADIGLHESRSKWLRTVSNILDRIYTPNMGWGNARDLHALQYSIQLHPLLPNHISSLRHFHDVYLASVPHYGFPVSLKHWSFYSQGSFYHLVVGNNQRPALRIDSVSLDQLNNELEEIRKDISSLDFHENKDPRKKGKRLPVVVYNVGQTQFTPSQLKKLAEFIFSHFTDYGAIEKNCHLFAWSMVQRTIMSKHDGSVFVGTRAQIVNWDILTKKQENNRPYSQETGYLLSDASRDISRRSSRHFFNLAGIISDLAITQKAVEIGNLYQTGPDSVLSFDPTGRTGSSTRYRLSRTREELRTNGNDIMVGIEDIIQKVKHNEFLKVLKAPEEQRLKQYEAILLSVKRGDKVAKKLVPFHRRMLSITEENDRVIRDRLQSHDGFRQISDEPEGFDVADIYWGAEEPLQNQERVDTFLAPQVRNPERYYHIGVAYLESSGSAAVTLGHCDSNTSSPAGFETIYKSHKDRKLHRCGARVLGILPSAVVRDTLALVLETPTEEQEIDRYYELYCVRMTERRLRHIALQSCPQGHQNIRNHSATFVSNFLTTLLGYLESQGLISNAEPYVLYLGRLHHTGLLGTTGDGVTE